MRQDSVRLVKLAQGLVDSDLKRQRDIVPRSNIEDAIDKLKCRLILAHELGGQAGVGQSLEVARIELQGLVEARETFVPMALTPCHQGQGARSLGIVRPLRMNPLENFSRAVVVVDDPVVEVTFSQSCIEQ